MSGMDWYYIALGFMLGWFWSLFVLFVLGGKRD